MEPVSILAISTTPRKGGNSERLLEEAVKAAVSLGARVEELPLRDYNVRPCQEDYGCYVTGECPKEDDYKLYYQKFMAVDRIIFAAPVFFFSLPAQAKALIDRCQCLWIRKYILKKEIPDRGNIRRKGYFLSTGGYHKADTFDCLKKVMKYFYMTLDMDFAGDVCAHDVDRIGEIEKHPDALKAAWELGLAAAAP